MCLREETRKNKYLLSLEWKRMEHLEREKETRVGIIKFITQKD